MRRLAVLFALALVVLAVLSPGVEALAGCLDVCPDESPSQEECSSDLCCSCCLHPGPLFAALAAPEPAFDRIGSATALPAVPLPPGPAADILHVPKPSAA